MTDHPARAAGLASQHAVRTKDRAAWLNLFAPDAVVEDPIGRSPYDPAGNGHRGRDAIAAFWDTAIAESDIAFRMRDSYACGAEVAFVGTITSVRREVTVEVDGVFTYRVDADGRIAALRAYWELDRARRTTSGPAETVG